MNKTIAPSRRRDNNLNAKPFDIDDVATDLILEHGAMILQDARRYSSCLADAEDAYQRSLVIMLTQAPSTRPEELIPWLRVVVRREAAAIARERQRVMSKSFDDIADQLTSDEGLPEENALDSFDVELGVEALGKLKPDQIKCLLAQADGKSYAEIADATGFSARKVARNVNEGRRAFMLRVEAIESGSECERVDALLPEIGAGDAAAIESVKGHLVNCSGCRTAVREYNEAPQRAVVLFPPALVAVAGTAAAGHSPFEQIAAAWNHSIDRLNVHAHGAQQWIEAGTYKKAAAVVALTATVATGGVAVKHVEDHRSSSRDVASAPTVTPHASAPSHLLDEVHVARPASAKPHRKKHHQRRPTAVATPQAPATPPQQVTNANESVGDGSSEFLPEAR